MLDEGYSLSPKWDIYTYIHTENSVCEQEHIGQKSIDNCSGLR